jgi:hypothetical protein
MKETPTGYVRSVNTFSIRTRKIAQTGWSRFSLSIRAGDQQRSLLCALLHFLVALQANIIEILHCRFRDIFGVLSRDHNYTITIGHHNVTGAVSKYRDLDSQHRGRLNKCPKSFQVGAISRFQSRPLRSSAVEIDHQFAQSEVPLPLREST